ncbi:hypothetical protein [Actinoplanes sp. NBRC 101535]|uniref:hypothetical protein n=1 Tax=Actinoplanes sp. NBRC 101535 TaxID=3032196 RepID=UPI0024A540BD|nr:hypothetical protein [Actinoplanes sp. NBRC 101535]GLY01185.1 hypothetical protein Acsp01_15640 [Actinoplanes sp. NBRC 101535]
MTDRQSAPETTEESPLVVALFAAAALAWTAAMIWSARQDITARADAMSEVTAAAYALPGIVAAELVAGAAAALLVLTLIARRRPLGATARFAVATGTGLLIGAASAVPMFTINTAGTIYAAIGGTLAAAGTIGGALAGFRVPSVVVAAGSAAVAVFVIGTVLNYSPVQSPLLSLLGADDTASTVAASQWFSYGQATISGLAAGIITFLLLRRSGRRTGTTPRWTMHAAAGAGPGVILVAGEILSRTAGSKVLDLAGKVSILEQTTQQILSAARLNSGLVVLFIGAISAIILVGRTLEPADDSDSSEDEDEDQVSESSSETAYHSNS